MREAECQARAHADPAGDPDDPGGAVKPDGPPKYSDQEQLSRQSDYRACGSQPRWRADCLSTTGLAFSRSHRGLLRLHAKK